MESASHSGPPPKGALRAMAERRCPRCRSGPMFERRAGRLLPGMSEKCPVCGLKFEREEGYFLGAMYISYGLALVAIAIAAAALWVAGLRIDRAVTWGLLVSLPLAPLLALYARVLWIWFDRKLDPRD
jgi:uncharacterized protein (DUF983 family)